MDVDNLNSLPENDIPHLILGSIFILTNVALANAKHHTNIIDLYNDNSKIAASMLPIIETSGLIDYDYPDIFIQKTMSSTIKNLHQNIHLSYTHKPTMANKYNNPDIIARMFFIIFLFGIDLSKMIHYSRKFTPNAYIQYLLNLDKERDIFLQNTTYSLSSNSTSSNKNKYVLEPN